MTAELSRLREEGPSAEELTKARELSKGRLMLRMEDTRSVSGWIGGQELLLGAVRSVDEAVAEMDAVTLEDLQRVAPGDHRPGEAVPGRCRALPVRQAVRPRSSATNPPPTRGDRRKPLRCRAPPWPSNRLELQGAYHADPESNGLDPNAIQNASIAVNTPCVGPVTATPTATPAPGPRLSPAAQAGRTGR